MTARRIVLLGCRGFFGGVIATHLRNLDIDAVCGSRRGGPGITAIDPEDPASLRGTLRPDDVVVDAAGPYQRRTMALIDVAASVGAHVIDIADSLSYVQAVYARRAAIDAARIAVLTGCSSVSAVIASLVRASGLSPAAVSVCLSPAAQETAREGSARSLLASIGAPVHLYRDGRLVQVPGWTEQRRVDFGPPVGTRTVRLVESADAITLPLIWPELRSVEFRVDTHVPGFNLALSLVTRLPVLRTVLNPALSPGLAFARWFGSAAGGLRVDVEDSRGNRAGFSLTSPQRSFVSAIAPAVLAARRLATVPDVEPGILAHDRHVDPAVLLSFLEHHGITVACDTA